MIRVRRGREPIALRDTRQNELARVRPIANARRPTKDEIGDKYTIAKERLWRMQWYKCCYCEHQCQLHFHDLEHYRPKTRADRGPGFSDHGYWWLAWSWENLLFACPGCKRSGKNDSFPLDPASTALQHEDTPPGTEIPLFIDPGSEDPLPEIQFRRIKLHSKERWVPMTRMKTGTSRAATTVSIIRLDRPELLDLYEFHVDQNVLPSIRQVQIAIGAAVGNNPGSVQSQWEEHVVPLVDKKRPHAALSYDVVDQSITLGERRKWGLHLSRP